MAARHPGQIGLRCALVLAIAGALAAASAGSAQAHALLVRADPADGSALREPPRAIRLFFDEEVVSRLTHVRLVSSHGRSVEAQVEPAGDTLALVARVPRLPRGVYRIEWQSVSADDLHATRGELVFGVGTTHRPAAVATTPDPGPPAGGVIARWLDFAAIALAIGGLAVALVSRPTARRAYGIAAGAAAAALCTGAVLLVVQASALPGSLAGSVNALLTETSYGPRWAVREVLVAALLSAALELRWGARPRHLRFAACASAVALCFVLALTGHAPAARGDLSVATAAMTVHLLAAAVWAGGLVVAVVVIGPLLRRDRDAGRTALRSFGGLAAGAVGALAVTGIYSLGVQVASPDALLQSVYGRTMLIKTGLLAAVGVAALTNVVLLRRDAGRRLLPRTLALEAVLAAAVLIPAAALTAAAPGRGPRWEPPPKMVQQPSDRFVDARDLVVHTTVKPNRPGPNFVTVDLVETLRPAPGPVTGVDVTWSLPGAPPVTDRAVRDGLAWRTPARKLSAADAAPLAVTVHRTGTPDATARMRWGLDQTAPRPRPDPTVSDRPLAPLLTPLAAILSASLAAAAAWRLLRRRPLSGPPGLVDARSVE